MTRLRSFLATGLLFACAAVSSSLDAQGRTVTGVVRSRPVLVVGAPFFPSGPVANAAVRVQGGLAVARSDTNGVFVIEVPANSADVLVITHPAYDPAEVALGGASTVEVLLTSSTRYNQYGVKVDRQPILPETRDGLLIFETADAQYRFWFDVRVNVDGAVIYGDRYNENGSGVEVRRARMAMKSQFRRHWYAELDLDFADSRADLKDAYLMYMPNRRVAVRWGNFKEVFSLEQNTSSRYLTFMERPMTTNALTPSRTLGTGVTYNRDWLMVAGGVHFGDVGGWEEVQNRKDNNADLGRDEGHSFTGKVILMPWMDRGDGGLHVGAAMSYRTPKLFDDVGTMRFDVRGPANVNRRKYIDTDRIPGVDHAIHTGVDVAGFVGATRIHAEVDMVDLTRKADSLKVAHFNGGFVQVSRLLFGGRHQYNANDGEFTQPRLGSARGDVELALRYQYLDLNSVPAGITGGSGDAWTVGVNLLPSNSVKFMLNWSYVNNDRYANGRGRLNVGRTALGVLTTDGRLIDAAAGKGGEDYQALAVRMQVSF